MTGQITEGQVLDFDLLWDYDNPAHTERKFRDLLPTAQSSEDTSYYGQLLTQIARTEGLQRKFDDAHRTLNLVQTLLDEANTTTRIRYLLERGRVFNSSGRPADSKALFIQAWEQARADRQDFYAVDAAHMLAIVESPENQFEWNSKALGLAERSSDAQTRKWMGSLYNNMGWTYFESKRYDKALETFHLALICRDEEGDPQNIRIAKWCVAKTLRFLGRVKEALEIQQSLLAEYEKSGGSDGFVFEELGECLLLLGRGGEARKFFALAFQELSKDIWLAANEPKRLERIKELGVPEQNRDLAVLKP